MTIELMLSAAVLALCLALAWSCRRSLICFHLLPLGLTCVALPFLRVAFGLSPGLVTDETLWFSYGAVAAYSLALWATARLLKDRSFHQLGHWVQQTDPSGLPVKMALVAIAAMWAVRIYLGSVYGILVSGSATEEAVLGLPYWLVITNFLSSMIGMGGVFVIAVSAARKNRLLWLLLLVEMLWTFFSYGRREFLFLAVALLWIAWQARSVRTGTVLFGLVAGASALYLMTPLFLYVRTFNNSLLASGIPPIQSLLIAFGATIQECVVRLECSESITENVATRGDVMEFLKTVVGAERDGADFLYGSGLLTALLWAIPSSLFSKPELMTEQFVQANFGLPQIDDAIMIPTLAYADLGLLGCLVAGICLAGFTFLFAKGSMRMGGTFLKCSFLFALMHALWSIEGDPLMYITLVRDSLLLIVIALVIRVATKAIKPTARMG